MLLHVATNITNLPKAGGLTTADLLAIVAVIVTIFGGLLTAIGALTLRQFTNIETRLAEQKTDNTAAMQQARTDGAAVIAEIKADQKASLDAIWRELGLLRGYLMGTPRPTGQSPPAESAPVLPPMPGV